MVALVAPLASRPEASTTSASRPIRLTKLGFRAEMPTPSRVLVAEKKLVAGFSASASGVPSRRT